MPIYHRLGDVPAKRHSVFRRPDGELYAEELMGNKGFVGPSSLLYHIQRPTQVLRVHTLAELEWSSELNRQLRHRHFRTHRLQPGKSITGGRVPLLFNNDVALSLACASEDDPYFYRNAQGDEVVFIAEGEGVFECMLGNMPFSAGDYIVIPRGILHRYRLTKGPHRALIIESADYICTPKRYRNEHGQLLESAPYSERDIRRPAELNPQDQKGEFIIVIKKENRLTEYIIDHHPFDVVGWDGYYYPWIFNIHDFEPRVGRFHLPPPVHQTFESSGFVVCSFCPRPYDFDPNAVPAPYNHSNVMSDEVLYYANSEFMSRKGIEYGSVTLHPDGIPHGPQPGRTEASLGVRDTNELAVMVDTFRPLLVSSAVLDVEDRDYYRSWV
ncbi:MAG: homogentisate 1,2-dioxygenase [Bryobacteraceae bacterium]|nr:homogentisate 1,2-dioxygenase [Bryobacteraceae bacterium]